MTHDLRIIELDRLPGDLRSVADFAEAGERDGAALAAGAPRALRLAALGAAARERLRREAEGLGVAVLSGVADTRGFAPEILVAGEAALDALGARLESAGEPGLGSAIRATVAGYRRTRLAIAFADGEGWDLTSATRVMAILNVTADSFSDGGRFAGADAALRAACRMVEDGADIVDVGGESTRPGAPPVPEEEELRRVVPVVAALRRELTVRISVDTMKASVARAAVEAGADMVNDVSALSDPAMPRLIRETRVPVVVMHMRGTPRTMQQDTRYPDLMSSIVGFLRGACDKAAAAGIGDDKILVDPGIGFGKSAAGSLEILRELPTLRSLGRPILVGASRKSFIGTVLDLPVAERLEGSLAAAALAAWQGAHVIRAHDVAATKRVVKMIDAIVTA